MGGYQGTGNRRPASLLARSRLAVRVLAAVGLILAFSSVTRPAHAALGARLVAMPDLADCGSVALDGWWEGDHGVVAGAEQCGPNTTPAMWRVELIEGRLVATEARPLPDFPLDPAAYERHAAYAACRRGVVGTFVAGNALLDVPERPGSFTLFDGVADIRFGDVRKVASVNDDCSRLVGSLPSAAGGAPLPVVWDGDAPATTLTLPSGLSQGEAVAVARHAMARIVGTATSSSDPGATQAVLWRDGVPTALPLPPGRPSCAATGLSAEGRFAASVCGNGEQFGERDPFLYGPGEPAAALPRLAGYAGDDMWATAVATGGDAPRVVGGAVMRFPGFPVHGVIWLHRGGRWQAFSADKVLQAQRLEQNDYREITPPPNASPWTILSVEFAATADGTVLGGFVGRTFTFDGEPFPEAQFGAYVLTLPRIFRVRSADVVPSPFQIVNSEDIAYVRTCLGSVAPLSDACTRADFDADDDVDRRDLAWVKKNRCRVNIPLCD